MPDQLRTVTVNPTEARATIEQWCGDLGVPFREAFSAAEAAELARRLHFEAVPGTVAEFQRKGYFACPDAGALSPVELFCWLMALDARRRWRPSPSAHDLKKSAARLQAERARAAGEPPVIDLERFTLEDCLLQLVGCDQRQLREALYECAREKLRALGFVEE